MVDIYKVIASAHDDLFYILPDILYSALIFGRPKGLALVSYSQDGGDLPKIYIRGT